MKLDHNPLAAIPVVAADVEAGTDNAGLIQVRRCYRSRSRVGRLLRFRYQRQVQLDEPGSFFWRAIDGQRSLDAIAARFAAQYHCDAAAARRAVVTFTRDLMTRDLIRLKLEAPTP